MNIKKLLSTFSKLSVASFVNALLGIIRSKILAIFVGTLGVGVISQLINYNNLIVFASAVGIQMGLTKYISQWEKEGRWNDIKLIVGQFNTALLILGISFTVFNILLAKDISLILLKDDKYEFLIIIISISLPISLINPLLDAVIRGMKRFDDLVKISILIALFSLILIIVLVYFYKLEGAIISISIGSVFAFIIYCIYFKKNNIISFSEIFSLNFNYSSKFRIIIKLGFAALIVGGADQLSQLIVRTIIIKNIGINSNGLYQSIYAISMNYFGVLYMSLGVYLLPVLSELKEKDLVNKEINSTLKLSFIIIVPLIISIYVFRKYLILLFYSNEFLPSTDLLFFNFLGDYFKAFSWIIGAWLIPLSRVKAWVSLSLIYYIFFPSLSLALLKIYNFGLQSIVLSYFISYVIYSAVNFYYISKHNGFRFSSINKKLFPLSFLFILVTLMISNYNLIYGFIIILPCILLWFKISITKDELIKGYKLVKSKISS